MVSYVMSHFVRVICFLSALSYESLFHVCSPCLSYRYTFGFESCLVSYYVSVLFEV
jgi:hypothetical protein